LGRFSKIEPASTLAKPVAPQDLIPHQCHPPPVFAVMSAVRSANNQNLCETQSLAVFENRKFTTEDAEFHGHHAALLCETLRTLWSSPGHETRTRRPAGRHREAEPLMSGRTLSLPRNEHAQHGGDFLEEIDGEALF